MKKQFHHMDEKIDQLKRHIAASPDANKRCKQTLIWLIDQTDYLTKSVRCIFHQPDVIPEQGHEIADGIHEMNSSNNQTRLDQLGETLSDDTKYYFQLFSHAETFTIQIRIGDNFKDAHSKKVDKYINIDVKAISFIDLDQYR